MLNYLMEKYFGHLSLVHTLLDVHNKVPAKLLLSTLYGIELTTTFNLLFFHVRLFVILIQFASCIPLYAFTQAYSINNMKKDSPFA